MGATGSFVYDEERDGRMAKKFPGELRHGEHLIKRRFKLTENEAAVRFIYAHHGIYDEEKDKVLQFGDSSHCIAVSYEEASGKHVPSAALPEFLVAAQTAITDVALDMAGKVIMAGRDTKVFASDLDYFQEQDGSVLVWEYPEAPDTVQDGPVGGTSEQEQVHYDRNQMRAVTIARWFYKYPTAFGKYHLAHWNCENFSSFCKTTDLTTADLEKLRSDLKQRHQSGDSADLVLPQGVLKKRSSSRSIQVERLRADWSRMVVCEANNPSKSSTTGNGEVACPDVDIGEGRSVLDVNKLTVDDYYERIDTAP